MFNYWFNLFKHTKNSAPLDKIALTKRYQQLITEGRIETNAAQITVLDALQQLLNNLIQQPQCQKKSTSKNNIKSLYIHGDVGRGKSLLMALFFESCPIPQKRRLHFADFMLEVHQFIHQWRKNQRKGEAFIAFAKYFRRSTRLLCLDEFQVTDIADAMILTRLFKHLWVEGIIFVMTSNQSPSDLYKDGLQRALFLPFISGLTTTSVVLELVTEKDYRSLTSRPINSHFHIGLGKNAEIFLVRSLAHLIADKKTNPHFLKVHQRKVYFNAILGDILYSSFKELCHRTLGLADYIEISKKFNTVFIAEIPQLSMECRDQAQRFVSLIDALYEANVRLICTVAVSIELLYQEDGIFEFKRTQSRLMEMQSDTYRQKQLLLAQPT
jgi:cell division protein ZapE